MHHHLPILFLFMLQDCHLTAVVLSTGLRMCLPLHFFFGLKSIIRPKSLIHIPLSPFSPYYRPTQVTPSYTPFTFFLFSDAYLFFQASSSPAHSFTLSGPFKGLPHSRTTVYSQLHHTQPIIISASDFAHSCTGVYMQLQPILLFLAWTSLIRTPRFTCSSSLLSLPQTLHIHATQSTCSSSIFHEPIQSHSPCYTDSRG